MTYDELDERAAGLLTTNQFARGGDLSPEVTNWIDAGGFCCCQDDKREDCPEPDYGIYYDYDIRITNFDDENTQHNKPGLEKFLELVYETFEVFSH